MSCCSSCISAVRPRLHRLPACKPRARALHVRGLCSRGFRFHPCRPNLCGGRGHGHGDVGERGQAAVEAAFLLPVLFLLLGIFVQPTILLYDRCVMQAAAAEGCRLYATATADEGALKAYVQRRLRAVPHASVFHEGGDAGWDISFSSGDAGEVSVSIVHRARPLPLFGVVAGLAAQMEGNEVRQEMRVESHVVPAWAASAQGGPADWVGKWA